MSILQDLTGQKFGKLTVIERSGKNVARHAMWLCHCECGNHILVSGSNLRSSHTIGCGCQQNQRIDEIGHKYGKLTVLKHHGGGKHTSSLWLCQCECGNTIVVSGIKLRAGGKKSCGCQHPLPKGKAAFNALVGRFRSRAKERGFEYSLTDDQAFELSQQPCFYCGAPPNQKLKVNGNGDLVYNGLDRVDNSKGYSIDNVVPCCGTCNHSKATLSIDEFRDLIRKIYLYWASKN
jgi:hypothetical protein